MYLRNLSRKEKGDVLIPGGLCTKVSNVYAKTKNGVLFFDGDIYNYDRDKYASAKDFVTDMLDSMPLREVVALSGHFDGFWSICYIDEVENKMYCWTDPLGGCQLYFANWHNHFPEVCSTIAPLIEHKTDLDLFYKSETFKWGYNTDNRTPWSGVKRVIPNHLHEFTKKGEPFTHFDPIVDWFEGPESKPQDMLELVYHAVESRINAHPGLLGLMLSGGIDSSIIAAVASDLNANMQLYTINNGDDHPYAHMMAYHLGKDIIDLSYNIGDEDYFKSCFKANETPIDLGSVVPNQAMFSCIPTEVILSGDGPDEMLGGYRRIDDYDSQISDTLQELTYYHLPRLDRACRRYGKTLLSPYCSIDIVKFALRLPFAERTHKKVMKDVFGHLLPQGIIDRPKLPLKNDELKKDPMAYRKKVYSMFYNPDFYENI